MLTTQLVQAWACGLNLLVKGRLRTLSSAIKLRKFEYAHEDAQLQTFTLGVLYVKYVLPPRFGVVCLAVNMALAWANCVAYPCA